MPQVLRWLWALPISLAGLVAGALILLHGGSVRRRDHTIEFLGGCAPARSRVSGARRQIMAMTLGHVILAQDAVAADRWRHHERVHVGQYERWGPLFPMAYLAASGLAWLRGGDAYLDNAFEVEARAHCHDHDLPRGPINGPRRQRRLPLSIVDQSSNTLFAGRR